jgi:hypothetical protein
MKIIGNAPERGNNSHDIPQNVSGSIVKPLYDKLC